MAIEDNASDLNQDFALLEEEAQEKEIKQPKREAKVETIPQESEVEEELEEKAETESKDDDEEEVKEFLPHERPTMEQVKKKFPEFFKTFPTLQAAFNRERQFSEVFSTPAEAKETAQVAEDYQILREDLVNGDGSKFIPALKESDSLGKFAKSFLPNLYKADKDVHWQVILPVIEDMVRLAFQEGTRKGDENLSNSALWMSDYLLGDKSVAEGKKSLVAREEPKNDGVSKREQEYENKRYNDFNIDVHESVYDGLIPEINKGFRDDDGLTEFVKESIRSEVIKRVVKATNEDKEFVSYKDRLWKQAKANGYRSNDKSSITNAVLARAKSLIPGIRRKLIGEALGSSPQEAERKRGIIEQTNSRKEPGSQGREARPAKAPSAKKIDWKKTSDVDFLSDNYTLKGSK